MRIDPKAPADSPHHPRNVVSLTRRVWTPLEFETVAPSSLVELADTALINGEAIGAPLVPEVELTLTPDVNPDLYEQLAGEPLPDRTTELAAALVEAGLTEPAKPEGRNNGSARKPTVPSAAVRKKAAAKARPKPDLATALAKLDDK